MIKPTIINTIDIDGKEISIDSLPKKQQHELARMLHDRCMQLIGYKRKTA